MAGTVSRRWAVRRLVALGTGMVAAPLLAACGGAATTAPATASPTAGSSNPVTAGTTSSISRSQISSSSAAAAVPITTSSASHSEALTSSARNATTTGTGKAAGSAVTLRAIHWNAGDQQKVYDDRLDMASATLPGITVERSWATAATYDDKVIAALASGDPYDVMWTDSLHILPLIKQSALIEVGRLLARDKVDTSNLIRGSATFDEYRFGPRVFGMPDVTFAYLMFYNLDLLAAAGAQPLGDQATWDQELELFQKVTKRQGDTVTAYGHDNQYGAGTRFMPLMWQFGGGLWRDPKLKTTLGFDLPGTEEAMQFLGDLAAKYHVMAATGAPNISFDKGTIATTYTSSYTIVGADQRWKFKWLAAFAPQKTQHITCTITNGWNLAATGKHPDAAWQLIRYLGGTASQTDLVQNNLLSVDKALNASKAYTTVPSAVREAIFASTATSRGLEDLAHPVMLDWTAEWGKGRAALLAGKTDAKTLFDEWQHRFQPQVAASASLYQ